MCLSSLGWSRDRDAARNDSSRPSGRRALAQADRRSGQVIALFFEIAQPQGGEQLAGMRRTASRPMEIRIRKPSGSNSNSSQSERRSIGAASGLDRPALRGQEMRDPPAKALAAVVGDRHLQLDRSPPPLFAPLGHQRDREIEIPAARAAEHLGQAVRLDLLGRLEFEHFVGGRDADGEGEREADPRPGTKPLDIESCTPARQNSRSTGGRQVLVARPAEVSRFANRIRTRCRIRYVTTEAKTK